MNYEKEKERMTKLLRSIDFGDITFEVGEEYVNVIGPIRGKLFPYKNKDMEKVASEIEEMVQESFGQDNEKEYVYALIRSTSHKGKHYALIDKITGNKIDLYKNSKIIPEEKSFYWWGDTAYLDKNMNPTKRGDDWELYEVNGDIKFRSERLKEEFIYYSTSNKKFYYNHLEKLDGSAISKELEINGQNSSRFAALIKYLAKSIHEESKTWR